MEVEPDDRSVGPEVFRAVLLRPEGFEVSLLPGGVPVGRPFALWLWPIGFALRVEVGERTGRVVGSNFLVPFSMDVAVSELELAVARLLAELDAS